MTKRLTISLNWPRSKIQLTRKTAGILCDLTAVSLTETHGRLIADFKKEFVIYDTSGGTFQQIFKRDYGSNNGRILGKHPTE